MNPKPLCIGVDLMGGEESPVRLFEAVKESAKRLRDLFQFVVYIHPESVSLCSPDDRILIQPCEEFISMEDSPLYAVRTKTRSSLVQGIRALSKQRLHAFVSIGNTGALLASASLNLHPLPGIKRSALLAELPTRHGSVAVLDVGGSVSARAAHLVQFAKMGVAYGRSLHGIECPRVGLLNIGIESQKGRGEHRLAYAQLEQLKGSCLFVGNVEGRELFEGKVDVLVTDGFTGNIFLKTSEGISSFIFDLLKESALRAQFDYQKYPGAILAGVDGIVVKCHGHSSSEALLSGILGAASLVERDWLKAMKRALNHARGV